MAQTFRGFQTILDVSQKQLLAELEIASRVVTICEAHPNGVGNWPK